MLQLIAELERCFPELRFRAGKQFCWSPESHEIFYKSDPLNQTATWSLLHETGHALLEHRSYQSDFELLRLELAAWDKARELVSVLNSHTEDSTPDITPIDEDHIQDCLDTYRDWLYKRSICPSCHTKCLQQADYAHYRCFNCHTVWGVTPSRFCRAYRSTKHISSANTAVFHLTDNLYI